MLIKDPNMTQMNSSFCSLSRGGGPNDLPDPTVCFRRQVGFGPIEVNRAILGRMQCLCRRCLGLLQRSVSVGCHHRHVQAQPVPVVAQGVSAVTEQRWDTHRRSCVPGALPELPWTDASHSCDSHPGNTPTDFDLLLSAAGLSAYLWGGNFLPRPTIESSSCR